MNAYAQLYDECLDTIKNEIKRARQLNRDAHYDLIQQIQSQLNTEILDFESVHRSWAGPDVNEN